MNVFAWMLIGHFVGDWLLQNDWMAQGKKQGMVTWAGLTHFTIYTATILGALTLASASHLSPMDWLVWGSLAFISHWWIDAANMAARWMRLFRQSERETVRMVVDQILHLLVLVLLIVRFFR